MEFLSPSFLWWTVPFVVISIPFILTWLFPCAPPPPRLSGSEEEEWVHVSPGPYQGAEAGQLEEGKEP